MTSEHSTSEAESALKRVQAALERLRARYCERYGEAVFDVEARGSLDGAIELAGVVLLPQQRREAIRAAVAAHGRAPAARIEVLASSHHVEAWCRALEPVADVLERPHGSLQTQCLPSDPLVRRLAARNEWWAVQLADGTIGWSLPASWELVGQQEELLSTSEWRRQWQGVGRAVDPEEWRRAAHDWLGVPYLWGGTTSAGVDCSALTQRLYRAVAGIGLPRNSLDQMRVGTRVPIRDLAAGDLLVLRHTEGRVNHVALCLDGVPREVVHASRAAGEVTIESAHDVLERYQVLSARRLVEALD